MPQTQSCHRGEGLGGGSWKKEATPQRAAGIGISDSHRGIFYSARPQNGAKQGKRAMNEPVRANPEEAPG